MGLLSGRGPAFLNRALGNADGVTLTYSRGAMAATLTGWPGNEQRDETQQPTEGTRRNSRERDYMIPYDAVWIAAGFAEPAVGDRIMETINGELTTWEIKPRDTEPAWRWAEDHWKRFRVHTRRVT
jgi:hypothetical protein